MSADPASRHRIIGLALMLGAVTAFTIMVGFVKVLREGGMSTVEVMVWRMAPGLPWVLFEVRRRGVPLRPRRPWPVAARVVAGGLAMGGYFWAVDRLTLLQNTVLHLTQPMFVAVLAPLFLKERLRGAAFVALLLALGGALVVIVPAPELAAATAIIAASSVPLVPGLVRLGSSLSSALAHMSIRWATAADPDRGREDAPETVVFHFTLWVTVTGLAIGVPQGRFAALPAALGYTETAALVLCMAAAGMLGQLLMSRAYARAEAASVAVVAYAAIPLSLVLDIAIWGASATISQGAGACLMVLGAVVLTRAERSSTRGSGASPATR